MGRLQDKVAIVTGGNSGVGAATALLFTKTSICVLLTFIYFLKFHLVQNQNLFGLL